MNDSPTYKNAHPKAKQLMDEDFFYSSIEESGPFGSDDGSDTFAGFAGWRSDNRHENPLLYLKQQLEEWGYPPFDLQDKDPDHIRQYIEQHTMGVNFLIGMDAAIIAAAFGQLYLEGTINNELNKLAKVSIDRQLHPELLALWDEEYRPIRNEQLSKMLSVLNRI